VTCQNERIFHKPEKPNREKVGLPVSARFSF
jgi:hypothetical protein